MGLWEVIEGRGERKNNIIPETNDLHVKNWIVSFWDTILSGTMLVSGRVPSLKLTICTRTKLWLGGYLGLFGRPILRFHASFQGVPPPRKWPNVPF